MDFFTTEAEAAEICRDMNLRSQFDLSVGYVVTPGPTNGDDGDDRSMDWCVMELEEAMGNDFYYEFYPGVVV
jgi:hypothetical protein